MNKTAKVERTVLSSRCPVTKKEICGFLPDVSTATVERTLGLLLRSGAIRKLGNTRSARYIPVRGC
ncbi:MAG: hypothetical protein ACI4PC_00070 [Oscillospiraceae bacterium]